MMGTEAVLRLAVADDHGLFRAGMVEVLNATKGLSVVAEGANGTEILALIVESRPDVALLDVQMPGPGIVPLIRQIRERSPSTAVVVVTMSEEPDVMLGAIEAGAKGFVSKTANPDLLVATIRSAVSGSEEVYVSAHRALMLRGRAPGLVLSERERQVLAGLRDGKGNKEIAQDLGVSEATVKRHLSNLYGKLEVSSRAQAILAAQSRGLFTP